MLDAGRGAVILSLWKIWNKGRALTVSTPYLTPVQIAERLNVTRRTVTSWCESGRLRASRVGGRWRIDPADLEAFLQTPTMAKEESPKKAETLALSC